MTADPALGFWLRAAEAEGALHEQAVGGTVVLLPHALRETFELPEEITVTADPEVAREDGALLLAQGHPVLDRATERVLDRGDVGRLPLAWPPGPPLSAEALVARLRDHVPVDHGRIDPAGEPPVASYAPVLRIGALVTFHVSLEDRFQERQEVWVDAATGLALPPSLITVLSSAAVSQVLAHRVLPADRAAAAAAAQDQLERRAGERLATLAVQSRGAREAELTRVQDYYRAALASLAKRRAAAPVDRQALLDARADATRAEQERRLAEVEEKFRGSLDTRWYRLHELLVPAATVPVTIRRGPREYPFSFRWLLPLHAVAPVRCPHCEAPAPLVAGKQRLGCTRCSTGSVVASPGRAPATSGSVAAPPVASGQSVLAAPGAPGTPAGPASGVPDVRAQLQGLAAAVAAAQRPPAGQPIPPAPRVAARALAHDPKRLAADGNRLALKFWEDVVGEDRRLARLVVPGSPADVALQVWGPHAPALAVGIPPGALPSELDAGTVPHPGSVLQVTAGQLQVSWRRYPYSLRWDGRRGRPGEVQVAEVVSGHISPGARLSAYDVPPWWRSAAILRALPAPRVVLDPVAAALWRVELPLRGPHLLMRCLAAWWRIQGRLGVPAPADADVAATIARIVAACAGTQVTIDAVTGQYAADRGQVSGLGAELRRLLALTRDRGW